MTHAAVESRAAGPEETQVKYLWNQKYGSMPASSSSTQTRQLRDHVHCTHTVHTLYSTVFIMPRIQYFTLSRSQVKQIGEGSKEPPLRANPQRSAPLPCTAQSVPLLVRAITCTGPSDSSIEYLPGPCTTSCSSAPTVESCWLGLGLVLGLCSGSCSGSGSGSGSG